VRTFSRRVIGDEGLDGDRLAASDALAPARAVRLQPLNGRDVSHFRRRYPSMTDPAAVFTPR